MKSKLRRTVSVQYLPLKAYFFERLASMPSNPWATLLFLGFTMATAALVAAMLWRSLCQ